MTLGRRDESRMDAAELSGTSRRSMARRMTSAVSFRGILTLPTDTQKSSVRSVTSEKARYASGP